MKRLFPATRMTLEAQYSPKRRGLFLEIFAFYIAFCIISLLESTVMSIPQVIYIFTKPEFLGLLKSDAVANGDSAAYMETINEIFAITPWWMTLVSLFATAVAIVAAIFICVKMEKRTISSMGIHRRGAVTEYLIGIGIGALLFGGAIAIACFTGAITIAPNQSVQIGVIIAYFFAFLVQGFAEEALCRGYLMITLTKSCSPVTAVVASAIVFALLHAGNANVTPLALLNIVLVGILFGIYMLKRGSIWGAAAIHSVWNFMQGNIFGVPVSGTDMGSSLFSVTLDELKYHVSGGNFGLEGGLAVTLVLLVGIGLIVPLNTKKSELATFKQEEHSF